MKNFFFVWILVFPLISVAQNYVIFSGRINNIQSNDHIVVVRQGYLGFTGPLIDTLRVDYDGYFADTIEKVSNPCFASWSLVDSDTCINKNLNIFLFPGYNLNIIADAEKGIFSTVKYYSCGAIANNYLAERDRKFLFSPADFFTVHKLNGLKENGIPLNKNIDVIDQQYTQAVLMPEPAYIDSLKAYYNQQRKFLKEYFTVNTDNSDLTLGYFPSLQLVDLDYSVSLALLHFPSQNAAYLRSIEMQPSYISFSFYNNLEVERLKRKDEYLSSSSYRQFSTDYVNLTTGELEALSMGNQVKVSCTVRFNTALKMYRSLTRDYVLGTILCEKFQSIKSGTDNNIEEAHYLMKRFLNTNPKKDILKTVAELYQQLNQISTNEMNK